MAEKLYTQRKIKKSFLGLKTERPRAELGQALVLTGGGAPMVLMPGERATSGEAAWAGYDTVYEVDLGKRSCQVTGNAPASDGIAEFQFTLSASYRVNNPRQVIEDGLQDPNEALTRVLTETVRRIAGHHDIRQVNQAAQQVREALDGNKLSSKLPFDFTEVSFKLEVDSARKTLAQTGYAHEKAILEEQHKQEIYRMRRDMYETMAQGGQMSAMMQQLAQRPDDIVQVADILRQQDEQQKLANLQFLQTMLDKDMIQDHHLKDVIVNVVDQVYRTNQANRPQLGSPSRGQLTDTSLPPKEEKKK